MAFYQEGNALVYQYDSETLRIEPWGENSLRVRASKVAPIDKLSVVLTMVLAFVILHETVTVKGILGGALIAVGTLILIL